MKSMYWHILGTMLVAVLASGCCGSSNSNDDNIPSIPDPFVPATPETPPPAVPTPTPTPGVPTKGFPMPGGNTVTVGMPTGGIFIPGLPVSPDGKPYIDYTLNIAAPGNYRIELLSSNTSSYDPYIILLQNGAEIGRDDDGHDISLQSRLIQMLQPGTYTVRVTKFGSSQVSTATPFTLTVNQG